MNKELEAISGMFEELKEIMKQILKNQQTAPTEIRINEEQHDAVRELSNSLKAAAHTPPPAQTVINRHIIDLMSNKMLIFIVALMTVIIIMAFSIKSQRGKIQELKDNDLKYRYIEMQNGATPEDILMLREIFDYNRDKDQIRVIRQQVNQYEKLIQEQAETEARARLNAAEAERLRNEAERLKGIY
ncbi:MAG: hypothetical protein LUE26_10655 [Alistipes sp.]|nr:hypothetical protein [Alistipes sp.]